MIILGGHSEPKYIPFILGQGTYINISQKLGALDICSVPSGRYACRQDAEIVYSREASGYRCCISQVLVPRLVANNEAQDDCMAGCLSCMTL